MANVPRVITDLASYTLADLEALEKERPELGRLEVIDEALHASGGSSVGNLHHLLDRCSQTWSGYDIRANIC